MKYKKRRVDFEVRVWRHNYKSNVFDGRYVVAFTSRKISFKEETDYELSNDILSYNFSENIGSVDGSFNFTLVPSRDRNNLTWMDKIHEHDLVFFSEFGEIKFAGVIENRDYSAEISGDGRPDRKISITGKGIGGLLSSFKMMLDQAVFQGQNSAKNLAQALKYTIATSQEEGAAVGSTILRPIYKSFMDLALKIGENDQTGNNAGVGVISIIDKFVDLERGISDDFVIKYPISLSLYKRGENSVWELWNGLAQPPVNEMFGYWDYYSSVADEGGFVIVFRQSPFESKDWDKLYLNILPPLIVESVHLGTSTKDVYSFYLCTLPGSSVDRNEAMTWDVTFDGDQVGHLYAIDDDKLRKYGYRPLFTEFRFFDRSKIEEFRDCYQLMRENSEMLKRWFQKNDEMYFGEIYIHTIDNNDWRNSESREYSKLYAPRIGERVRLLNGEFYVEGTECSWNYGGPMMTRLQVSRGYIYSNGEMMEKIKYVANKSLQSDTEKK